MAFRPDGKVIATGSWDRSARLWDSESCRPIGGPLSHQGKVHAVAFDPVGKYVATGGDDGAARLWDAGSGRPIGNPLIQPLTTHALAFSPDGRSLVTGGWDEMSATARIWEVAPGPPLRAELGHPCAFYAAAISPDGRTVVTGGVPEGRTIEPGGEPGTARLWDAGSGRPIGEPMRFRGTVSSVAFRPDGKVVAVAANGGTELRDAATGKLVVGPLWEPDMTSARWAVFSPDGKTLLLAGWGRTARLWDAETGRPVGGLLGHKDDILGVAYSPDGRRVATASVDGTARLWDAATGRPSGEPMKHRSGVYATAFGPDGSLVATASDDGTAQVWEAATGRPVGPRLVHQGPVVAVAFRPDNRLVATASGDRTAQLWDVPGGRAVGGPLEHQGVVGAVSFGPDGRSVMTGSDDGTARHWDAATGWPIGRPLPQGEPVRLVAFGPDGRTALTRGRARARLWDVPPPVAGDPDRLKLAVEVLTGMEMDERGRFRPLDPASWDQRRRRVAEEGLAIPRPDPVAVMDPTRRRKELGCRDNSRARPDPLPVAIIPLRAMPCESPGWRGKTRRAPWRSLPRSQATASTGSPGIACPDRWGPSRLPTRRSRGSPSGSSSWSTGRVARSGPEPPSPG